VKPKRKAKKRKSDGGEDDEGALATQPATTRRYVRANAGKNIGREGKGTRKRKRTDEVDEVDEWFGWIPPPISWV
jgi:hypothetical protein